MTSRIGNAAPYFVNLRNSVPDPWHFEIDPDPWIRTLRILLFLAVAFKMLTKNEFYMLSHFLLYVH